MLHIQFEDHELPELRKVLDRAMNCQEPKDRPAWLQELSDQLDKKLGQYVEPYQPSARLYADD